MSYIRIGFLLAISYFLIKNPHTVTHSNFVVLLGQAMQVKFASVDPQNPLLSALSVAFASLAVSDLIPLLAENLTYFETLVPVRLVAFFFLAAFSYLAKSSILSNNLVFTYAFFEIWLNFLIYNNLRDEKYARMKKFYEENESKIRELHDGEVKVIPVE